MPEQPFLIAEGVWMPVKDGNVTALSIFKRHYTARAKRKIEQFIGPGQKMALLTADARALFVWRKFIDDSGQLGVNCAVFRNEGDSLSSELILAAECPAWERWPGERLYTFVDPKRTRHKRDPGRCFLKAGWRYCGWTKSGLRILEKLAPSPLGGAR